MISCWSRKWARVHFRSMCNNGVARGFISWSSYFTRFTSETCSDWWTGEWRARLHVQTRACFVARLKRKLKRYMILRLQAYETCCWSARGLSKSQIQQCDLIITITIIILFLFMFMTHPVLVFFFIQSNARVTVCPAPMGVSYPPVAAHFMVLFFWMYIWFKIYWNTLEFIFLHPNYVFAPPSLRQAVNPGSAAIYLKLNLQRSILTLTSLRHRWCHWCWHRCPSEECPGRDCSECDGHYRVIRDN